MFIIDMFAIIIFINVFIFMYLILLDVDECKESPAIGGGIHCKNLQGSYICESGKTLT